MPAGLMPGWLESLQISPYRGHSFIAADVHGPNPGIYLFAEGGRRSKLVSVQADSPSGIGIDKSGITTLVDVNGHKLRQWRRGREISPALLNKHGVMFPNDARRDPHGVTIGGSIGASVSELGAGGPAVIRDQPLWLVQPDGQVSLSSDAYTCLNGIAFGDPGTVYAVESFGERRLVEFTYNDEAAVCSEWEVYSFISSPDGICSFKVNGQLFLAVAHPFTYEISILALTGEVRQVLAITAQEGVGQPITPVVEVHGSEVVVTSVVTIPGAPSMFDGSRSGLASVVFNAELLSQ